MLREKVQQHIQRINVRFNTMSPRKRKKVLVVSALVVFSIYLSISVVSFFRSVHPVIFIDQIRIPKLDPMNWYGKPSPDKLIPLGKLKGEIDGEFEAFYLAFSKDGNFFINRQPERTPGAGLKIDYDPAKGWEEITKEKLDGYLRQLHFIPSGKKGLTP